MKTKLTALSRIIKRFAPMLLHLPRRITTVTNVAHTNATIMKTKLTILFCILTAFAAPAATIIDKVGIETLAVARSADLERYNWSAAVRLTYDLTPRLGAVLEAEGQDFRGNLVDSTFGALRVSLARGPVQPYLIGGGGWKLPSNEEYLAGGGGVRFSLGKNFTAFAEALAEKGTKTDTSLRLGIGLGIRF
jgi:hypothetical protein